ncbi:MAG TPA: hypothetical protein PKN08_03480, partial [Opitutaceae bacterium]|nr:hypothetical protein [Opitutaceae bacterium]
MHASESPTKSAPSADKTAKEDLVPISQKIGYGLGTYFDMWGHWLYPTIAFQIFGLYLGVSPYLIGWAVILNGVFDAVSDPVFG